MDENSKETWLRFQAETLPEGWIWDCCPDGSGRLIAPDGKRYFRYDLWTAEYVNPADGEWTPWPDICGESLESFRLFAEGIIREKYL